MCVFLSCRVKVSVSKKEILCCCNQLMAFAFYGRPFLATEEYGINRAPPVIRDTVRRLHIIC
jgi:hypothetical protein